MEIVYQLEGAGWAGARVIHGTQFRDMSVSYLSDALGDMAKAALLLLQGADEESFEFFDEPGMHRWQLARGNGNVLSIRILWFEDEMSAESGIEVFECKCPAPTFIRAVIASLENVLVDEGIEGYKRRWIAHEFPSHTYSELRRLFLISATGAG